MKTLKLPYHLGIIPDGNGRWAIKKGMPRLEGHKAGIRALQKIVAEAASLGIPVLTVFAFSTENWKRPKSEIDALFALMRKYLNDMQNTENKYHLRIKVIGRKDRIPCDLMQAVYDAEKATENEKGMLFNIAFDYGSLDEITRVFDKLKEEDLPFTKENAEKYLDAPMLDLLIRTGKEKRLSNFLLWQAAYAELYFTDVYWPSFTPRHLIKALASYGKRKRRYGGVGNEK